MTATFWVIGLLLLVYVLVIVYLSRRERRSKRAAALIARCEQQHAALMRFDTRLGTYGEWPPANLQPHKRRSYDLETVEDLPCNLDMSDIGRHWTVESDGKRYVWDGDAFRVDNHLGHRPWGGEAVRN